MKLLNLKETYTGDIPPRSTIGVYCGVGSFRDACYQLVSAFLIIYISLAGVLDHDPGAYLAQMGVISLFIIICRIWDGINDPIMGWIIEKFHFKWGKYKPWILIGAIANTAIVLCLFLVHPTGWGFVGCFCAFYFLWDIAWTINDIAYWSMLPSLTKNEQRRNKITSIMQIFISVGVFIMFGVGNLLPPMFIEKGIPASTVWRVIAIIVSSLYLISQIVLVLFMKEHTRSAKDEAKERQDASFKDIVRVLKQNDQLRINMISILLQYIGAACITGFGTYYGYLIFGYGGTPWLGGFVVTIITVMYGLGSLGSQAIYPALAKKFTRKKILTLALALTTAGYIIFFFTGFPVINGTTPAAGGGLNVGLVFLLFSALLLFFGQGLMSVVMLIQMQSTIEYNEWKYGDRKEAVASSMRAFVAKMQASLQQGIIYAILAIGGLYDVTRQISDLESQLSGGFITGEEMNAQVEALLRAIEPWQKMTLSIGMVLIPIIFLVAFYILATRVFKIDEKKYAEICTDLDKRHGITLKKNIKKK